jgi:hypothetical protein
MEKVGQQKRRLLDGSPKRLFCKTFAKFTRPTNVLRNPESVLPWVASMEIQVYYG